MKTPTVAGLVPPIDAAHLRRAMSHVPTSVVVVTAFVHGRPTGMVIGTFTSVSLDPPLVGFFAGRGSRTYRAITSAPSVSYNVLPEGDGHVVDAFRLPPDQRFGALDWTTSRLGGPHLVGSLLVVDAVPHSVSPAGDHDLVLSEVVGLSTPSPADGPLVFLRGRMAGVDRGFSSHRNTTQACRYG